MAPKKKAEAPPSTPAKGSDDEGVEDDTPTRNAPTKNALPKKPKTPRKKPTPAKIFHDLVTAGGEVVPIGVSYENDTTHGTPLPTGGYVQVIKLIAPQPFELLTPIVLEDGLQAIVIKPSKAFPFMKLPLETRNEIYKLLLTPIEKLKIEFTSTANGVAAKEYAKEMKNRVALLQVNKEICDGARRIVYGNRLRFDNSTTLLNFLTTTGESARKAITEVDLINLLKPTGKAALTMLAECRNLTRVMIVSGVGTNCAPEKAAKTFFNDGNRLLLALLHTHNGDKDAALGVLRFGNKCCTLKEDEEVRHWDEDEFDDFMTSLKSKLQ